jgi:hypothetical protein
VASTLVLLTPKASLIALAFLIPLAALAIRERRDAQARVTLGLTPPPATRRLARALGLVLVAALVAAAAAQPALRDLGGSRMRTDAEIYLTVDVSRSMLATSSVGGRNRLDRARALARRVHRGLPEFPTGVAAINNRMMPLLFPILDGRGVSAVLDHSVAIAQPPPARLTAPRATQLGAIGLAAHRTYFSRSAQRRALVVFSDLDTDEFGLSGTLTLLRRNRIEPFLVRVAAPGERIFDPAGRAEAYRSTSTLLVTSLRTAGWHAYEESQIRRAITDIRSYAGTGPTRPSGVVEAQRNVASLLALGALVLVALLTVPSLVSGLVPRAR